MNLPIISVEGYDPIPDGIDEDHYSKVRQARKEKGLPVNVEHPFRYLSRSDNPSHITSGHSNFQNQFEQI